MDIPIHLMEQSNILVVGAGGGFDFVCGLPIAFELEDRGHNVFIGNYSFTDLSKVENAEWQTKNLLRVNADSYHKADDYFPERHLSTWYRNNRGSEKDIWCFSQNGVIPTLESYNYLIEKFDIDILICVDGGVDGIFRGDEYDLGTPSMDSISVIAASLSKATQRIYVCSAFGVEGAESGLSHAQVLNRIADMVRQNAFLGVSTILKNTHAGKSFRSASDYIHSQMQPHHKSTMVSSIIAAMDGYYGRTAVNLKTNERQPWISPLTALYWYFHADEIAKMKLFYRQVLSSHSVSDVSQAISLVREKYGVKPHESIPI